MSEQSSIAGFEASVEEKDVLGRGRAVASEVASLGCVLREVFDQHSLVLADLLQVVDEVLRDELVVLVEVNEVLPEVVVKVNHPRSHTTRDLLRELLASRWPQH